MATMKIVNNGPEPYAIGTYYLPVGEPVEVEKRWARKLLVSEPERFSVPVTAVPEEPVKEKKKPKKARSKKKEKVEPEPEVEPEAEPEEEVNE